MLLAHLELDLIPLAALVTPSCEVGAVEVFQKAMRRVVRSGGCKCSHRTDRLPVVAVVVVPVEVARIEVEVPRVVRIVRIWRRRPAVAVRAGVVEVRVVAVAGRRTRYRAATFTRRRRESGCWKPSANFAVIHRHEFTSVLAVGSPLSFIEFAVWHAPPNLDPADSGLPPRLDDAIASEDGCLCENLCQLASCFDRFSLKSKSLAKAPMESALMSRKTRVRT